MSVHLVMVMEKVMVAVGVVVAPLQHKMVMVAAQVVISPGSMVVGTPAGIRLRQIL